MRIRAIREHVGDRANAAHYLGEHTIVERNGWPFAVLVPYTWWEQRQHQEGQGTPARAFTPALKARALARVLVATSRQRKTPATADSP
ncbi:hypothetical protein [Streptosporangium roseum]|uniref:hypothetical protein n=1 Tax=Streptosporangium roseum TaxID=2001 RepID=UPI003322C1B0